MKYGFVIGLSMFILGVITLFLLLPQETITFIDMPPQELKGFILP